MLLGLGVSPPTTGAAAVALLLLHDLGHVHEHSSPMLRHDDYVPDADLPVTSATGTGELVEPPGLVGWLVRAS